MKYPRALDQLDPNIVRVIDLTKMVHGHLTLILERVATSSELCSPCRYLSPESDIVSKSSDWSVTVLSLLRRRRAPIA